MSSGRIIKSNFFVYQSIIPTSLSHQGFYSLYPKLNYYRIQDQITFVFILFSPLLLRYHFLLQFRLVIHNVMSSDHVLNHILVHLFSSHYLFLTILFRQLHLSTEVDLIFPFVIGISFRSILLLYFVIPIANQESHYSPFTSLFCTVHKTFNVDENASSSFTYHTMIFVPWV